ncbi:MAG: HEAT repeat domain-containing protein [Planctomycetia bacterium]|nr:HEAT repeat domain-containing protein [Planctomycetia bacterium]
MLRSAFPTRRAALLVAVAWSLCHSISLADDASNAAKERELLTVLQTGEKADQALACKQLAIYGSALTVPELAKLLEDEQLNSWARTALEAIPGPEADEALRNATDKVSGRLLVGVLNSIGVRRDAGAVEVLIARLPNADGEVASAAAVALGRIGNDAAAQALRKALSTTSGEVRSAVAEGCILCAERMLEAGRNDDAVKLYDEVRESEAPRQRILEATRGAILSRGNEGIPLLVEQLRSSDRGQLQIGLSTARELPGREVAQALGAELANANPQRAVMLLAALADREDAAVTPEVLIAANSGASPVRVAAVGLIGRAGDASHLATLLEICTADDGDLAQRAKLAIATLPGDNVNAEIAARLATAKGKQLLALLEAVGERRIAATESLVKLLDADDAAIRGGALASLGETVEAKDLHVLIAQAVAGKNSEDAQAAQRALRTASLRMADREACAQQLTDALAKAPSVAQVELLRTLGAMGGPTALETIRVTMRGGNETLQDAGSQVLGEWMNVEAGPALLELAKDAGSEKYRIRALRGYLRLARQFQMSDDERAAMCAEAIAAASRIEEQNLALAVLERYPSVPALRAAIAAGESPTLQGESQRVALAIVQKLDPASLDMADLLEKLGLQPVKIEIVKAEYGAGESQRDVTDVLKNHASGLRLIGLPSANYNECFGGDPSPNVVKHLKVSYLINGKPGVATFDENATVLLPMPE